MNDNYQERTYERQDRNHHKLRHTGMTIIKREWKYIEMAIIKRGCKRDGNRQGSKIREKVEWSIMEDQVGDQGYVSHGQWRMDNGGFSHFALTLLIYVTMSNVYDV